MSGIREQAHTVPDKASNGLDDDEGQVERYGNNIYCREVLNGVRMMVMTMVVMMMVVMMVVIVICMFHN